jgi:hypothetical protein
VPRVNDTVAMSRKVIKDSRELMRSQRDGSGNDGTCAPRPSASAKLGAAVVKYRALTTRCLPVTGPAGQAAGFEPSSTR